MSGEFVMYLGRRTLETALLLSAPVLGVTLALGLLVAMFQAVTSIRDMTLGMVLKLFGVGLSVLLFGGWMMHVAIGFTREVLGHLQSMGG